MSVVFTSPTRGQQPCNSDGECNDGIACTSDQCVGITNKTCQHLDTCPDSTFCDGLETCCTSASGCNGVPRGSCEQGPPIQCNPGEFCSESLDRCTECTSNFHCDDGNSCTTDVCAANGTCTNTAVADNTPCNLPTGCYSQEVCLGGECIGTPLDCQDVAPPCKIGNCNGTTGQCVFSNAPNGTSCFDADNCTAVDKCANGVCVGGPANGCIDLRLVLGQTQVNVGDVVDVHLYADANGCTGGQGGCPVGTQAMAGVETVFTWDPLYLELANPATIGEFNPEDPCTTSSACDALCGSGNPCNILSGQCGNAATCDLTCGPNVYDTYDNSSSTYPKDCVEGDQINAPCPSGWPANDGTGYYVAQQQFQCGGSAAAPMCAVSTNNGLHVSTWKFRAIKATNGVTTGAPIQLNPCLVQTRTLVSDGVTPGHDVLKSIPSGPVRITINCANDNQCPAGQQCSGGGCGACPAPQIAAVGSRYLAVTPAAGTTPIALRVVGQDATVGCIAAYAQTNGTLGPLPAYRTPAEWMVMSGDPLDDPASPVVNLRDADIVAGMTYGVQADCNQAAPGTSLSPIATARTWRYGDVDNNNVVDIIDATRILDGFRGTFHTIACSTQADCANVAPYRSCELSVGKCRWIYFENVDIIGASPSSCQPERSISITDVTVCLDAFRSRPDGCRGVCP